MGDNNSFVAVENKQRTNLYHKDEQIEQMIQRLNNALMPLETYVPSGIKRPTVFIFGLPRSGTTLVYQLLSQSLDLGYINNLIARFWLAPLHGIALSRTVLGDMRKDCSFESDYGKTNGPYGPHEFAYFWQKWLGMKTVSDMLHFYETPTSHVDWEGLGNVVCCMQDAFDSGMVFKTNFVANFVLDFALMFPMSLFVYVERDPVDVALSILKARKEYYGDYSSWWATFPPEYNALKCLPFDEQIAGQVCGLRSVYAAQIDRIEQGRVVRFRYADLCRSPRAYVKQISEGIQDVYGTSVQMLHDPPAQFGWRGDKRPVTEEERRVVATLKKYL